MAKSKKCNCEAGAPLWIVTYGDLMSLLMTFFVLLLSFSTISEEELLKEALNSFRGSVGFLPRELTSVRVNPFPRAERPSRAAEDVARRIRRQMQILGREQSVEVAFDGRGGLKITLPSEVLFGSATADVKPEAFSVLTSLAEILGTLPEAVFEVRGHTDDRPLTSSAVYRDNHDLSFARADAVGRFLSRAGSIPLERFEMIARGAGEPKAPNDTPEGRQANRRVDIHVRGLPTDEAYVLLQRQLERQQ